MSQRGFTLIVYLVLALAILGTLTAIAVGIRADGIHIGEARVQARWDNQIVKDRELAARRRVALQALARQHSEQLHAAQAEATDYYDQWRQARENARRNRTPLGACVQTTAQSPAGGTVQPANGGGGLQLRVTRTFVSLYDGAWTGPDGQPVFRDPGRVAAGPQPADPAVDAADLDQVLDVHQRNAASCSEDRRLYARLVALIKDLRAKWDMVK